MELVGENLLNARRAFRKLHDEFKTVLSGERRYWQLAGEMQALANYGLREAKEFMRGIDLSKAPKSFGEATAWRRVREGPPTTSVKGARRALQADPNSPNKTFGVRPNNSRGDRADET